MRTTGFPYLFSIVLFLCIPLLTMANTFIVTSKADNGPGTLREAITLANANGTAVKDYIYFNLPGTTAADVSISLATELPALTSNIVLDGSTQPSPLLGASGARVYLNRQLGYNAYDYYGLRIDSANHVEIYGVVLKKAVGANSGYGIYIGGASSDIIIGAPGKGNVINGYTKCIGTGSDSLVQNLTIQSNIIGLEEDGMTSTGQLSTYWPVDIARISGLVFGGAQPDMGNVVMGNSWGVMINCDGGPVVISHNKIGSDITGMGIKNYIVQPAEMFQIRTLSTAPTDVLITDNLITGNCITLVSLQSLTNGVKMLRNKIGTDITGQSVLGSRLYGIAMTYCGPSLIGGSVSDENVIAGCNYVPVLGFACFNTTFSKNELFCNNNDPFTLKVSNGVNTGAWPAPDGRNAPFIQVMSCDGTSISGTAPPNATIEAFTPYKCTNGRACDGRDYIESFKAGPDGKWTYQLNGRDGAIFSATDVAGATSDYSNPYASYDPTYGVEHASCGLRNGRIKDVVISNGTPFYWEDEAGNIVGRDTVLSNVTGGRYRLVMFGAGCNKPECADYTNYIEVWDISPRIIEDNMFIQPANCGARNGSVQNVQYNGRDLKYSWRNAANVEVWTGDALYNVGPGKYTVTITDTVGGCSVTGGPYEVTNISGPVLDVSNMVIKDAPCNASTGSITGLRVTGAGTITYTWIDATGGILGNTPDLLNIPAGKYVLQFSDASTCGTAESDTIEVKAPGVIVIDQSRLAITPADCSGNTGSITGLQIPGGETIRWTNAAGNAVGNTTDLFNLPQGVYTLTVNNATGCSATANITVDQYIPVPITVTQSANTSPNCNKANGSVTNIVFNGGVPVVYRWENEVGQVIGRNRDLLNVAEGTYKLYVTDAQHCEQMVKTVVLHMMPLPTVSMAKAVVTDDACDLGAGSIHGLEASGIDPMRYRWLNNGNEVATTLQVEGLHAGDYLLEVKDAFDCMVNAGPFHVNNINTGTAAPVVRDILIVKGMTAAIKVVNPLSGVYRLYQPGMNIPLTSGAGEFYIPGLLSTTVFEMDYQHGECISPKVPVKVEVVDMVKVIVPNAFSPNGDGKNDIFRPKTYGLASYTFSIYDRWGAMIFETSDPNIGWNGYVRERKVSAGTYVWMLHGMDITGKPVQQQGVVTVVF